MKKKITLYLLVGLFLNSCYQVEKPEKPENLLSEDQMVNLLVDMALMSSAKGINKRKLENNGIIPNEFIYKKNNIDSATFALNNDYYVFNVNQYKAIYVRVKDSLTKLRDHYKAINTKGKKEKKAKKKKKVVLKKK
jgi:hypothetical protein